MDPGSSGLGTGRQLHSLDTKRQSVSMDSNLVASLLLVAMPFVPSSFLLLVVRPKAPSSATKSDGLQPTSDPSHLWDPGALKSAERVLRLVDWSILLFWSIN